MDGLWTSLIPLIIGSAVVPVQIVITVLLLRTSRLTAVAWVAGMTVVRLSQGVIFGLVLSSSDADVGQPVAALTFIGFVTLAASVHLALVGFGLL